MQAFSFEHFRYRFMTTNTTTEWTPKQGQYLAFIYYYTKIMPRSWDSHRQNPTFNVTSGLPHHPYTK